MGEGNPVKLSGFDAKVKTIIADQLGVEYGEIKPESSLADDLGANELDIAELVMALEQEFAIQIPDQDSEHFKTVGDVINYILLH